MNSILTEDKISQWLARNRELRTIVTECQAQFAARQDELKSQRLELKTAIAESSIQAANRDLKTECERLRKANESLQVSLKTLIQRFIVESQTEISRLRLQLEHLRAEKLRARLNEEFPDVFDSACSDLPNDASSASDLLTALSSQVLINRTRELRWQVSQCAKKSAKEVLDLENELPVTSVIQSEEKRLRSRREKLRKQLAEFDVPVDELSILRETSMAETFQRYFAVLAEPAQ